MGDEGANAWGALFFRGSDPAETLQAFGVYRVQCMIGSPASAAEFVGYYENSPDFICPFETMLSSGGMLSALSDGSVRMIGYQIDAVIFRRICQRNDRQAVTWE